MDPSEDPRLTGLDNNWVILWNLFNSNDVMPDERLAWEAILRQHRELREEYGLLYSKWAKTKATLDVAMRTLGLDI